MMSATKKNESGFCSQLWPLNGRPNADSSQFTRPRFQSNIQFQMVIAATTGVAQASRRAICRMTRTTVPTARISSARPTPTTMVTAAVVRQKRMERPTTTQVVGLVKSVT